MKKIGIILLIVLILGGSIFIFISFKKHNLEKAVVEHLITEKSLNQEDILSSEAFIANLPGSKNFMVSIKLAADEKTYYYYRKNGEVILESYVKDGREYVQ